MIKGQNLRYDLDVVMPQKPQVEFPIAQHRQILAVQAGFFQRLGAIEKLNRCKLALIQHLIESHQAPINARQKFLGVVDRDDIALDPLVNGIGQGDHPFDGPQFVAGMFQFAHCYGEKFRGPGIVIVMNHKVINGIPERLNAGIAGGFHA